MENSTNLLQLQDLATAAVCSLEKLVLEREQPSPMKYTLRLASAVGGRVLQDNLNVPPVNLPLNSQVQGQDLMRVVSGTAGGLIQNKSVQKAALDDGLRLGLSSLIAREAMKMLKLDDMKLL